MDCISLLGITSKDISNWRKSNIKYSLPRDSRHLCSEEQPIRSKYLLGEGDMGDIGEAGSEREATELVTLARKSGVNKAKKKNSAIVKRTGSWKI